MPISNPQKTVLSSEMSCDGLNTVTVSFDAAPELDSTPSDILLIMDRSGSLAGVKMTQSKRSAQWLVQTVARASGDPAGKKILHGSHMAVMSFADEATTDTPLTDDAAVLNTAIDALSAEGRTNHTAAFHRAFTLLRQSAAPRRVIVMFTDGETTMGGDPMTWVDSIQADGIEIYCIGLTVNEAPLQAWASDPDSQYVAMAEDTPQLQAAFSRIAAEVVKAGALDVEIQEVLNPAFEIQSVSPPSHGSVVLVDSQTLQWTADAVGAAGPETASLSFVIRHINQVEGVKSVNQSISYSDRQKDTLVFPDPKVTVVCKGGGGPVIVESCPPAVSFQLEGCQDAAVTTIDTAIGGLGRIVQADILIQNVCPGKRIAVAAVLSEADAQGTEQARGLKTFLIPPQTGNTCQDVQLKCVSFVVPEALDTTGNTASLCNARSFSLRVLANYVDTDFACCDAQTAPPESPSNSEIFP